MELTLSVSPSTCRDARHIGLAAEFAFGAHFACDARHFRRERAQLLHHRVQGFLEQQDLAAHVDRNLLRLRSPLAMAVATSAIFRTCAVRLPAMKFTVSVKILPCAGDTGHLRLATKSAFSADLARDARHFAGERVELIDHRVDGVFQLQNFALDVDRDLLRKVAARHGRCRLRRCCGPDRSGWRPSS